MLSLRMEACSSIGGHLNGHAPIRIEIVLYWLPSANSLLHVLGAGLPTTLSHGKRRHPLSWCFASDENLFQNHPILVSWIR